MDNKRFLTAAVLSLAVIVGFNFLFPSKKPATTPNGKADSAHIASPATTTNTSTATAGANPSVSADSTHTPAPTAETTTIAVRKDSGATFTLTNMGATPVSAIMNAYDNRSKPGTKVDLVAGKSLIKYSYVTNQKAQIDLSTVPFSTQRLGDTLLYSASIPGTPGTLSLRYTPLPDGHTFHVTATVAGVDGGYLAVHMPETFDVVERDSAADLRAFAYSYNSKHDGARSILFQSLDPGEKKLVEGPITWVAAKSKYFVVGLLTPKNGTPFDEVDLVGGARVSKTATQGQAMVAVPVKNGTAAFDVYAGPQEWRRLHNLERDFDHVNPYGWAIFRGVLQPIATSVIRLVLWMHRELNLTYGLVLIALGVLIRIILWPLNQSAMRNSLKMQALQPQLQALQTKYKDNPEKQRTEMMKVYADHNMSPLSPILGCLPMLIPMPILLALFFVFQNTIEFRGVSFLWLNDLSAHDPLFILPVIMAASMYVLSWLGMRNTPPNPQAKIMSYMMPGMFLIFLGKAAAGLNLYYAAQNIAALPQQWLLTRNKAKVQNATTTPASAKKKS